MTTATTPTDLLRDLAGTWDIDPTHSEVAFSVRHLMVSRVRGRFTEFTGSFEIGDDLDATRVEASIALASIDTGHAERDAHLRSADFFDVEHHPTMTFSSRAVRRDGDHLALEGDLTIRGITHPVVLDVEVLGYVPATPFGDSRVGFSATTEIDRRAFGLVWNAPVEGGGVLVGHTVRITLEVEAIRRADA